MNKEEKDNILDQHKQAYDGYVTRYNQESNQTPLYVQDYANDKNGITVNNKGVVKPYTNMGINESHTGLDMIGGDQHDQSEYKYRHLKNGTVDLDSEMNGNSYPSPNEDEESYISLGGYSEDMEQNLDQYEYDIDELEDFSTDELYEMYHESDEEENESEDEFKDLSLYNPYYEDEEEDELTLSVNESLDMFKRLIKYN